MKQLGFICLFAFSCANNQPSSLSVEGGEYAEPNQFPASVKIRDNYFCSAVKTGDKTFLTAAHCVYDWTEGQTLEITNHVDGRTGWQQLSIDTITKHPSYTWQQNTDNLRNLNPDFEEPLSIDLATITFDSSSPTIPAAELYHATIGQDQSVTFTGYGCEGENTAPRGLKFGTTTVVHISNNHIWTDFNNDLVRTCSGDSGGPLYIEDGGVLKVSGIVSGSYENISKFTPVRLLGADF